MSRSRHHRHSEGVISFEREVALRDVAIKAKRKGLRFTPRDLEEWMDVIDDDPQQLWEAQMLRLKSRKVS